MTNTERQKLVTNGKALTKNSDMNSFVSKLKPLTEQERRDVLGEIKGHFFSKNNVGTWSKLSAAYGKVYKGGKRKTRKSKKASRKTRKHRKH